MPAELATITGVELLSVGMDWPASTGPATVSFEHIASIVASQDDPHVVPARTRLGHESDINGEMLRWSPFSELGDAEPSFGTWTNLSTTNSGATLIGDWTGPAWLVDAAVWAFPSRSCEPMWDVVTPGGKRYPAVLSAVALLGVAWPACQDLEDLQAALSGASQPEEEPMPALSTEAAALSVSIDRVRRAFNYDWATDPDNGVAENTYWWWARDVRVDPDEVIVDDDEGGLWSVPFTTDGADAVTFGEPVRVRETFEPLLAAAQRVASAARTVASFSRPSRAEKEEASRFAAPDPAASVRPENEETPMDDNVRRTLAAAHGLDPDAATEEQVNAAVIAAGEQPETPEGDSETPPTPEPTPEPETEPAPEEDVVAAAQTAAAAAVSTELERRDREAAAAAAFEADRDAFLESKVLDGTIHRDTVPAFALAFTSPAAAATAKAAINEMKAGVVPVLQRRAALSGTGAAPTAEETDARKARRRAALGLTTPTSKEA
jgi:hypothetical protein